MRSVELQFARYKAVRSIVFCLRQNAQAVSATSVAQILRLFGASMHRAALCRYLRIERHENAERIASRRVGAMTEPQWHELLASGIVDPRPARAAAPPRRSDGTAGELSGNRSEPQNEHKNEGKGTARELSTRKKEKENKSCSLAIAQLQRPQASDAVNAENAKNQDAGKSAEAPPSILAEPMPAAAAAAKTPKQGRLPIPPSPERIAASKFLAALWPRVQPVLGRMQSCKKWTAANSTVALDLVTSRADGGDPDAVIDVLLVEHERLSAAAGEPIYSVARLQRSLIANSLSKAQVSTSRANLIIGGEAEHKAQLRQHLDRGEALRRMLSCMTDDERGTYFAANPSDAALVGGA